MSYLLDTCVLSEYVKKKPNEKVIQWLDEQEEASLFISLLSIGEIKKGIIKIEKKQPQRYQKLNRWLQKVELRFSGRIIDLDREIMNTWAILCGQCEAKGQKLPIIGKGRGDMLKNRKPFSHLALCLV
jgi:hypothetical protein